MVRARDGVGLATDVYRPPGHGPFPVMLERTPYDKSAPSRSERTAAVATPRSRDEVARYFVGHGYAVVYQDCRGRYRSEGRFTKYLSEAEDGYDTLAWLWRQPWCNGRIATMGLSYAAHAQMALGCLDPPGLAAQFLDCGGFSNAYRSGIRHGGAFDLKQATWAYATRSPTPGTRRSRRRSPPQDIAAWFARDAVAARRFAVKAAPEYEDYLFEQWSHGNFDDYWKQPGIYAEGYYGSLRRCADGASVGLVRPLCAHRDGELRRLVRRGNEPGCAWCSGRGPMATARSAFAGEVEFGAAAPLDGNLGDDFLALRRAGSTAGCKGIDNGVDARAGGAGFRDGRRIGAAQRRRPARAWRLLARVLPTGRCRRRDSPASTCTPIAARSGETGPGARAAGLPLRPAPPGADDRRRALLGRAGHARRRLRPAQGAEFFRRAYRPIAAVGAARRAVLRDPAARPRDRDDRPVRSIYGSPDCPTPIPRPS